MIRGYKNITKDVPRIFQRNETTMSKFGPKENPSFFKNSLEHCERIPVIFQMFNILTHTLTRTTPTLTI